MLAQFGHADQRLDAARPGTVQHEFSSLQITQNKFKLQSERFQNRVANNAVSALLFLITTFLTSATGRCPDDSY